MPSEPLSAADEVEAAELIADLPPREALSIVDPGIFGLRNPMILGRAAVISPGPEATATDGESST